MPLILRFATEDDAEAVHTLIMTAFDEYRGVIAVPPGALRDTLASAQGAVREGRTVLAYVRDDSSEEQLVGTARYEPRDEHLYVGRVAVHPAYRRHGVGKALMAHMEDVARSLGYNRIYLGTRASMPGNLAFYERLGYVIVSREPRTDGPDVNIWFQKDLIAVANPASLQDSPSPEQNPPSEIRRPQST